jgi:hypothetical protein
MAKMGQIPWLRIAAEGVAIVASILLAFAIDAAWAGRQEASRERAVLNGLADDFRESRAELVEVIEIHDRSQQRFESYLAATPAELLAWPSDSVVSMQVLAPSYTFDPRTATLDGLQSAGELRLIQDPRIQSALADWSKRLVDLDEDAADMLAAAGRVTRMTERHGGPFGSLPFLRPAGHDETAAMRSDPELMGAVRTSHYNAWYYVAELRELLTALDQILVLLEHELR